MHRGLAIRRHVERRMMAFRLGEWVTLLPDEEPPPVERKPPGPEDNFKTALRWARLGLHGRALAALDPTPLAQPTAATVEAVQRAMAAHRVRVAAPQGVPHPRRRDVPVEAPALVAKVKGLKNGISPGILGWRNEFVKLFLKNPYHVEALRSLVHAVAEARAPPGLVESMTWTKVTPAQKPGSTMAQPKVRPLESADTIRKLATGLVIQAERESIDVAFAEHQFAVGTAGGPEALSKVAQFAADCWGFAVIRLDGTSAFNAQSRAAGLTRLAEVAPALANLLASFYARPSERWVQEGAGWTQLWTSDGWAQGDPGPLLPTLRGSTARPAPRRRGSACGLRKGMALLSRQGSGSLATWTTL